MKGPLSSEIYDTSRSSDSWWRASAPEWTGPAPLASDSRTDVAIIGGGYAGLACAIQLAGHGIGSTVLEAGPIGWGASGRNGGMVGMSSHKLSDAAMMNRYGAEEAARCDRLQREGVDLLRDFCVTHNVPTQGRGEAIYAHSARAFAALSSAAAPENVTYEIIPPFPTGDMARFGGIRICPGFGVHPLRLVRALADHAAGLSVRICPMSEVTEWRREGHAHLLVTDHGTIRADRVVIATNGFTPDGLHPTLDDRAVPVISNIAVTRVLSADERARHPWLQDDPVADSRNLLVYLRMLPEGRLMFGMRGDLTGADANTAGMKAKVARRIGQQFPGWAGVEIAYFWRGPICATARYTPAIGRLTDDPSVFHAFGWHGSGVNGAQVGGRLVADLIAGTPEETIPAPYRGICPRLPLPSLRPAYVGLALMQQRIADVLS